jgi:hypothetical protein
MDIKEKRRQYYINNRDRILEKSKQYYNDHKEESQKYNNEYRSLNGHKYVLKRTKDENIKIKNREYYNNNKDKLIIQNKQSYYNNREERLQYFERRRLIMHLEKKRDNVM